MKISDYLTLMWAHRTKIIGYVGSVLAALAIADPAVVNRLLGPTGMATVMLVNNLFVIFVGHYNSNQPPQVPPA